MRRDISYLKFPNPAEELKCFLKEKKKKVNAEDINSQHGCLETT